METAFAALADRAPKPSLFMQRSAMEILQVLLCSHHDIDYIDLALSCLYTSEIKKVNFVFVTMQDHTELWSSFLWESNV